MKGYLRKANMRDCKQIFEWANDSQVRINSFHPETILYEDHKKWFQHKLSDSRCDFYIYMREEICVGQIRIDWNEDNGLIDYSISREYRHCGYGTDMLRLVEINCLPNKILVGEVKSSNKFSMLCFEKMGYKKEKIDGYIKYYKIT